MTQTLKQQINGQEEIVGESIRVEFEPSKPPFDVSSLTSEQIEEIKAQAEAEEARRKKEAEEEEQRRREIEQARKKEEEEKLHKEIVDEIEKSTTHILRWFGRRKEALIKAENKGVDKDRYQHSRLPFTDEDQIDDLKAEYEAKLQEARRDSAGMQGQLNKLRHDSQQKDSEIRNLVQEKKRLQDELDLALEDVSRLNAEMESLRAREAPRNFQLENSEESHSFLFWIFDGLLLTIPSRLIKRRR